MFKKIVLLLAIVSVPILGQPASASSHADSLKNLSMNDIMFAQGMIPHHQQAINISTLALKNSKNSEVKRLASEIISAQRKEIKQMKYWLTTNNAPVSMGHEMGMEGMLSDTQLTALKKLTGTKFDLAFLSAMIGHHKGAIGMVPSVMSSKNSEVRQLGMAVKTSQTSEIATMKMLIAKISK